MFLFFFPTEKQEKQEIFPKFKFNRGQNIWKASHPNIWGGKTENMEAQKMREKKCGNLDKKIFGKNGP